MGYFRAVAPDTLAVWVGSEGCFMRKAGFLYDKAPYCPIYTDPTADWYANRPLSGDTAKISRQRLISIVDGQLTKKSTVGYRLKKKKGKEEEVPGRRPRLRAARAPSPPAGHPHDVTALTARGRLSSPALGERPR
ncbi:hypothetical protein BHM03_00038842 [Ensete ventricosum]|nr:hypothetical protein BHM03_00038842 [Ensete ventricosum]